MRLDFIVMGHSKHDNSTIDTDLGYERNDIQIKGIIYFAVGLFLLIVITFGLMAVLLSVLEQNAVETLKVANPMLRSDKDRLPSEPRLQSAPGFGVDGPNGRVNLELMAPQAEYWELRKQYEDLWKNGSKDKATGVVTVMPIEQAKEKLLSQQVKAAAGEDAEKIGMSSRMQYSDSSSGRIANEKIR